MTSINNTVAILLPLVVSITGCVSEAYKIETRVHRDGTIERAICQPASSVSESVRKHAGWQQIRAVGKPNTETVIRQMKPLAGDGDKRKKANEKRGGYFAGWGQFSSAEEIPDHFVVPAAGLDRQGRLHREYRRHDLGLVVEHLWRETLTDVVELDDRRRASDELVKLMFGLGIATLEHRFQKKYRFALLEKWTRSTAAAFVADMLDLDLQAAIRRPSYREKEIRVRMIRILDRYGLKVADASGRLLKEVPDDADKRFVIPYVRGLLKQHVRDASGQPISEEAIDEILIWLGVVRSAEEMADVGTEPGAVDDKEKKLTPLEESWQAIIKKRFGSEKAFEATRRRMTIRIFGVYRSPFPFVIFGTGRPFDVSLRLPGRVVETNGKITGEGTVVWNFAASEAFPLGYEMGCRSLETREQSAVLLAKLKPADRLGVLLKLVDLVDGDADPLVAVLRSCATKKNWTPLEVFRRGLDPKKQANEVKRLNRLYRLLELPLSGSGRAAT